MSSFSHPNPMRAHGAWIYLFASVGAGTIVGADGGIERMLLVGTGFIGAFQVFSAFAVGTTRNRRQILVGCGWAAFTFLTALAFGAHVDFLAVAAFSIVPAALAIVLAKQVGYLSRSTLASGLAALSLAAPTVAVAGGVSVGRSLLLFLLLWPFFCWRTWRIAAPLRETSAWNRAKLKQQGLREAAYVALWSLAAAIFVRTVDGLLLSAVIGPIFPTTSMS